MQFVPCVFCNESTAYLKFCARGAKCRLLAHGVPWLFVENGRGISTAKGAEERCLMVSRSGAGSPWCCQMAVGARLFIGICLLNAKGFARPSS